MVKLQAGSRQATARLRLRPNPPMPGWQQRLVLGALACVMTACAVPLIALGLWVSVLYSVLEFAVVVAVLRVTTRRASRREIVEVDARRVCVRWQSPRGEASIEWPSAWVRIRLVRRAGSRHPPRVLLGTHGRWVEVGTFLNARERLAAAQAMKQSLAPHSAWSDGGYRLEEV